MILDSYQMIGGVHPETATVKNILSNHGVINPISGQPLSEAMILGIGGGLGSSYILWEFQKHGYPSLVLAFRNKSNYAVKYLETLCGRLGAKTEVFETGGIKKAAQTLEQTLAAGMPAIVWVDLGGAPYFMHFLEVGVVVVYGSAGDEFWVDNLAQQSYIIDTGLMAEARAKVPSFKNRIVVIEPGGAFNLEDSIKKGLKDHLEYLGGSSTSFALPAVRKWMRLMTDTKNDKGWPTVFKGGRGLYGTLRTIYEAVELIGTGGGGLRGLYADFLDEADPLISGANLKPIANLYRGLQIRWSSLAQAALPDHVEIFRATKEMLDQRAAITLEQGSAGLAARTSLNDALYRLKGELNPTFPQSDAETAVLFEEIRSHLEGIYQAEKEALAALDAAVNEMS